MRYFSLYHGKHEDQSLAHLSVRHAEGFNTVLEAMLDFRGVLMEYMTSRQQGNSCCNRSSKHNFCPVCGTDLREKPENLAHLVADLYLDLFRLDLGTLDGSASVLRRFEQSGWELSYSGNPEEQPVVVVNVDYWLEWDGSEDMPYMEAIFPDGTQWNTWDD